MKKRIILLSTCFMLLTACQGANLSNDSTPQATTAAASTEGENIPDNKLVDIGTSIDSLDVSGCKTNILPFYMNVESGGVGIVKYTNNAEYTTKITIKNAVDSSFEKIMSVPAHANKEIRFSAIDSAKDGSDTYLIDLHCSEANLNGVLSVKEASKK